MNLPVDYSSNSAPNGYECTVCGVRDCRMWRQYQTLACYVQLLCLGCASLDQKKNLVVRDGGTEEWIEVDGVMTDAIGWLVPAVPTEEGDTYWGYTSVPQAGVEWWQRLPLRSKG